MAKIQVTIEDTIKDERIPWRFPEDERIRDITEAIIKAHGLPRYTFKDGLISYKLERLADASTLRPNRTLGSYSVEANEVLRISSPEGSLVWEAVQTLAEEVMQSAIENAWGEVAEKWARIKRTGASGKLIDQTEEFIRAQGAPSNVFEAAAGGARKGCRGCQGRLGGIAAAIGSVLLMGLLGAIVSGLFSGAFGFGGGGEVAPTATEVAEVIVDDDTPTPEDDPEPDSTNTPRPTRTPRPGATPSATSTEDPCTNDLVFVSDVSVPDGTIFQPGDTFVKEWRLQNNGTCDWSGDYTFNFTGGELMGAPATYRFNRTIAAGETFSISLEMEAPANEGVYRSNWQMTSPDGDPFGQTPYVEIVVQEPTPTPSPTPDCPALEIGDFEMEESGRGFYAEGSEATFEWEYFGPADEEDCLPDGVTLQISSDSVFTNISYERTDYPISDFRNVVFTFGCGDFWWWVLPYRDGEVAAPDYQAARTFTVNCPTPTPEDTIAPSGSLTFEEDTWYEDNTNTVYVTASDRGGVAEIVIWARPSGGDWEELKTCNTSAFCEVNYTPRSPGEYQIYVSITDQAGNTQTLTATIAVNAVVT